MTATGCSFFTWLDATTAEDEGCEPTERPWNLADVLNDAVLDGEDPSVECRKPHTCQASVPRMVTPGIAGKFLGGVFDMGEFLRCKSALVQSCC